MPIQILITFSPAIFTFSNSLIKTLPFLEIYHSVGHHHHHHSVQMNTITFLCYLCYSNCHTFFVSWTYCWILAWNSSRYFSFLDASVWHHSWITIWGGPTSRHFVPFADMRQGTTRNIFRMLQSTPWIQDSSLFPGSVFVINVTENWSRDFNKSFKKCQTRHKK